MVDQMVSTRPRSAQGSSPAPAAAPAGSLIRDRAAIQRIPEVPRWGSARRHYTKRFALAVLAVTVIALSLILFGNTRWTDAGGIALLVPGAGFLYDAWPILFVLTWVLFWLSWNLWIGFGSMIHLIAVYATSVVGSVALADGPRLGTHSGTTWPWAIPVALIGAGLYVVHHLINLRRSHLRALQSREARNKALAAVSDDVVERVVRSFDPPSARPHVQEFDPIAVVVERGGRMQPPLPVNDVDATMIRWLLRISMQPRAEFDGWDWGEDAVEASALRYQVNEVGYALAYFQANYAPAYPRLLGQAQRNVIDKAQEMAVWGYWYGEEFMGNFRRSPDPVVGAKFQNVMFGGFLAKHLAHYQAATGDLSYDEPNSLTFTWEDGRSWSYSYPEIARHCAAAYAESPMSWWPCEPHQIYSVCNQMGAAGVRGFSAVHGTDEWDTVSGRYLDALDHEWMKPNGDYYGHFNSFLGMNVGSLTWNDGTSPMFMDGNQFIVGLGRTMSPEIAARLYLIGDNPAVFAKLPITDGVLTLPPAQRPGASSGRLARLISRAPSINHFLSGAWSPMEKTGYPPNNTVVYAGIGELARLYGEDDIANAAVRGMDAANFLGPDADRPFHASLAANTTAAKARWSRLYKQDDFLCARIPRYDGPILASAPYPDVLVTYANGRDDVLCLTLEPTNGPGEFELTFERLAPSSEYQVGTSGRTFHTDAAGAGVAQVRLSERTTQLIRPTEAS
ncbi:MAG: hypothetical protein ACK5MR_16740 [Cumulibacter sp.]